MIATVFRQQFGDALRNAPVFQKMLTESFFWFNVHSAGLFIRRSG